MPDQPDNDLGGLPAPLPRTTDGAGGLSALLLRAGDGSDFVTVHPDAAAAHRDGTETAAGWADGTDPERHQLGAGSWEPEGWAVLPASVALPAAHPDQHVRRDTSEQVLEVADRLADAGGDVTVVGFLRHLAGQLQ